MPKSAATYISTLLEGQNPTGPPPSEAPWSDLAHRLHEADACDRHRVLTEWVAQADGDGAIVMSTLRESETEGNEASIHQSPRLERLWSVDELLETHFEHPPVLVGERNNAILVRGEGHLMVGPPGIGKTLLAFDLALRLACGLDMFGYPTTGSLRILIWQAELPMYFVRYRFNRMYEGYLSEGVTNIVEGISRIRVQEIIDPIDLARREHRKIMGRKVGDVGADVVILDPFLSFFGGEENSNSEVRRALDAVKIEIAEDSECAVIITDHLPKNTPEKGARVRGAGAKIDWASLVINLSSSNALKGQQGHFISAELTKVRYGLEPREPFRLRRDSHSLRHSIWISPSDNVLEQIRQIIIDEGGQVAPQRRMLGLLGERFGIGARRARRILDTAVESGLLEIDSGRNNVFTYQLAQRAEQNSEAIAWGETDD